MTKSGVRDELVLVGVLKNKRDLALLLAERWYRIPVAYAPKRKFRYLAFYQPAGHGRHGKCIRYYARVLRRRILKRRRVLPNEPLHPRASEEYLRFRLGAIKTLARPIKNIVPRRISFGFTTLKSLLTVKTILQLYNVTPTEQIMAVALKRSGIRATAQYYVVGRGKRYCLDFAVFCKNGPIAIECDNLKAHSGARQRAKDKAKDIFLRRHGWKVIRLTERDIISDLGRCVARLRRLIRSRSGLRRRMTKKLSKFFL